MPVARRSLLAAVPLGVAALAAARAVAVTTDLALSCDLAAAPAMAAAAKAYRAKTGVRVRIFPTVPALIVPQLEREIQNDIVVTQPIWLDQAERAGVVQPGERVGFWQNRLAFADTKVNPGGQDGPAVPDPSPGSDIDGFEVLRRMGRSSSSAVGVLNTDTIATMLRAGEVRQGLLHQTEVVTDTALQVSQPVPDDIWPPILYSATVSRLARRPHPEAFVAFLGSADGQAALGRAGLEIRS